MYIVSKVYTDGRVESVNASWSLREMQEFIGGYVELIYTKSPHRALLCDEEGLLKKKPVNIIASVLVKSGTFMNRSLRGDCLVIKV